MPNTTRRLALVSVVSFALVGCAAVMGQMQSDVPAGATETLRTTATLVGSGISGKATFIEFELGTQRAVHVVVHVKGDPKVLLPGKHGMHLHAVGDCSADGFTSAGGHFDPGPFGNTDPDMNHPYHLGDLPNMVVDEQGVGTLDAITTRVTLSEGPLSLFDADGSAIILHKNPDMGITGAAKSGVSGGPRLACGVILKP
jgi:Cu-Zn family superoxide dismutase